VDSGRALLANRQQGFVLSPALALSLLQHKQSRENPPEVELSTLTEREREVLALLADGLSNKAIAARLYLSVRTVDGHLSNLYSRLGVRSLRKPCGKPSSTAWSRIR
jgi:non-specific serine/threonine protein kinase